MIRVLQATVIVSFVAALTFLVGGLVREDGVMILGSFALCALCHWASWELGQVCPCERCAERRGDPVGEDRQA